MASALDRLRRLIEEDEESEGAFSGTPANARSKAAYNELLTTGKTTYGGKTYTLPGSAQREEEPTFRSSRADTLPELQRAVEAGEMHPTEAASRYLGTLNKGPAQGIQENHALTPALQAEFMRRNSGQTTGTNFAPNVNIQYQMSQMANRGRPEGTNEEEVAAWVNSKAEPYQGIRNNKDYLANTKADEKYAVKSLHSATGKKAKYNYITNLNGYADLANTSHETNPLMKYDFMTDNERKDYTYIANTQGLDAAEGYLEYLDYDLNARASDAAQAAWAKNAQGTGNAVGASATAVLANSVAGLGELNLLGQNINKALTGKPVDYNAPALNASKYRQTVVGQVSKDIEKAHPDATVAGVNWRSFLYQTGMSMADSAVVALMGAAGIPNPGIILGSSAAVNATLNAKERGLTDAQALTTGLASGIAEMLFEDVSLEKIIHPTAAKGPGGVILNIFRQAFTEGSEEVATTLANTLTDAIINGDKSEILTRQRELQAEIRQAYQRQGVSIDEAGIREEARRQAWKEWGTGLLTDLLGGAISGGVMGVGANVSNYLSEANYRKTGDAYKQMGMTNDELRDALVNVKQNTYDPYTEEWLDKLTDRAARGEDLMQKLPSAEIGKVMALQAGLTNTVLTQTEYNRIARLNESPYNRVTEDAPQTAQRRATPPLPQQAAQITPESVTTPPVPGNAQRGAEGTGAGTNGRERTEAVPHPALRATFPQGKAETEERNGPPLPQRAGEESQTLGNPGRLRVAEAQGDKERMLWTAPKNYAEWAERYGGDKPAADAMRAAGDTALMDAFMDEAASENADKPIVEAYLAAWESVKQGTISPMAAVGIVSEAYRSAGADGTRALVDPGSGNLTKEALNAAKDIDRKHRGGLRVGQAENPAAAVRQQANAGQNETAPAAEAAEAGNDLADGGRGGLSGQRAGEQDGRLAKLAEARSAVSQFDTASRRRSDAKNLPSERVNARDHIAEAAEGSTLTFAPEQMVQQDKELRTVKRRLESITGRKVYYTLGGIKRTGADGKTGTARAAITPDGIYLRCDDDSASVTQLAGHELYHYYEEQFPGLHEKVRQKITERYSEEEFREIAGRYAEKLGRLNGMAEDMDAESYEAMLRRIESEIFADAFGNINYFRMGADRYTDTARETVNETLGSETAAATEQRTGPPTQFSEGETLQERIDRAIELLDNNTPASEVFRETGLIAMAGGQLQDGFGGEIVGRYSRGGNNEGRVVPSGPYDGTDGRKAGRGVEASSQRTRRRNVKDWKTLSSEDKGRITKAVDDQMKSATKEGKAFYKMFNTSEEFAQRFYEMLQQDRVVAEQWAHLIPNIDALMDELENIGAKETSFSASEDEDIPESAAEYSRQRYREENREPQSAAEYSQMKQRALEREAEIRKLEKKGEASAEDRREAAWARREFASPKEKANKQQATIAKKDLRNTIISEFGIPDGRKAEIGKLIDAYADQAYKDGKLTETDRQALFDKLYSEGVMTVPADDAFRAAREIIKGGRVYVPESVKHEFGDDWGSFRREAFAEGILLTNNKDDMGWDSWNVELSGELPGLFAEDETDPRDFLERVVHLAREGRDQEMSLAEYAASVIGTEYVSEDDLLDNMERKLDWALRSYADKAGLEIWMKNKTEEKLARQREKFGERLDRERAQRLAKEQKEREKRKEAARKQTMNRELREMQQRTLKQLQWLSKNRQKFSGDMQDRLNEILADIDVYAVSAADEAHIDNASGKTWRELADIYKDARENDPNFLPSKDLERIVARLDNRKIGDLDINAVTDLYKAAVGLRTELYNRNNVIGSELHETFQEVYDQAKSEIQSAKGGYQSGAKGKAQKFFSDLQLTPMNLLERMAGWNKDSAWYKMAKQLEQGERKQRKFKTDSARMLAPFLEEHKEWVKKADGQGKDAIWYEVEVPELLELGMGDKPIFGNTVKVWMTPAQKVHLYLESQNYDNLRHMTGGRTFADKELYSKGKRAEAFAQGKTIRLAPESVKNLVKDLTPEEKALADALRPFYNEFSKKEINRVSNLLLGYDKAMEGDYAPIYTNQNYTKSEPGIFDTTAEGVGNLKSRVYSSNPSLNISALDAFEKSVDRTSRYVGLAIPVRNMNTLMNWREKDNSMADVLTHKWGEDGKRFVNDLLTELQRGRETEQSSIEKLTNAALSRYISAVFGANPSIVTKQFASYPLAAAYLGWENMPLNVPRAAKVDTDLIAKYTGEYDYRQLGYAMPETATLKDNPGKLQERGPLNFIFGGGAITWMDGFTVRTLWTWAENKVNKEQPGLERGSKEQIDAGNSEYYKAVAAEFEEALSRSQPMYDTMHRANIMRESNPITRAFTLFKTVPMQEYNMLRQAIGEAQYAKEAKLDKETQAAARQKAGRAFAGILTGNLMIGAITILNALWKNRGKKYRDEDGELSAEKLIAEAGKQYFKDAAGLVIGGGEAADLLSSILFGEKWYGLETPGMEQIGSILEQTVKAGQTVQGLVKDSIEVMANGGNWAQYMADHSDKYISAVDSVARTLGTYATGLPIDNVRAYLLGAVQWLSPEVKTAYEDIMDKADRSGLKGLRGASLEIRTKHILQERAGSAEDSTVEALAGLYAAGYKDAIPAAQQTKITVDGEERQLNLAQQQTYKRAWQSTVGGSIDELVGSKDFQNADEATQAKMLKKLYDLANKKAASALFDDYEDSAIGKADAYTEAGASLADYAAMSGAVSGQKRAESYETILGSDMSDEAKLAAIGNIIGTDMVTETGNPTQWARLNTAVKDGLSVDRAMELMQSDLLDDYVKFSDAGVDSKNADSLVTAISKLKPEEGYEEVRGVQKWNAIIGTVSGSANQEKALKASMTESQWKAYKDSGVGAELYVKFKYDTRNYTSTRDAEGKEVKGQTKKDKMIAYIDGLNASTAQKDALYLTEYKESGLSDTPWHKGGGKGSGSYAMARTPALRIPEAPRAEKIQSGLRSSTGEPAQRQSSGLRIRDTQPSETRQGSGLRIRGTASEPARQTSGLRIRDSAPAAQAPRSGLRIRAK